MRQAGRYMPEYRALRQKYSFLEMVHNPEIAAHVTLLPIDLLDVDAAILFCDILVIAEAFGLGLHFDDGIGPIIERPLKTPQDIDSLPTPNVQESFGYVATTIKMLRQKLKVPLIGFSGAPFTLASYMIEGRSSRDLRKTKQWMLKDPASFHRLLKKISSVVVDYLKLQIEAGAQAIQLFDSWAHFLGHRQFAEFSLHYFKEIIGQLPAETPSIAFCRGSSLFAPQLATCGASAISIDWNGDLAEIRKAIPIGIALQGNLDPDILYAPTSVIKREVHSILKSMKGDPAYIFNLGHGVLPDIPFEHVRFLVDEIKNAQ
jgi:uroporphyrinogen decarboxylase